MGRSWAVNVEELLDRKVSHPEGIKFISHRLIKIKEVKQNNITAENENMFERQSHKIYENYYLIGGRTLENIFKNFKIWTSESTNTKISIFENTANWNLFAFINQKNVKKSSHNFRKNDR